MAELGDLSPLARRERSAYAVLGLGVLGLVVTTLGYVGPFSGGDVLSPLAFGVPPYALAALATWRASDSWDATSWLYGTWIFLVGASLPFQLRFSVIVPEYGMFGGIWLFLLPLAQLAVVAFAAAVAFVLHRRELRGL